MNTVCPLGTISLIYQSEVGVTIIINKNSSLYFQWLAFFSLKKKIKYIKDGNRKLIFTVITM